MVESDSNLIYLYALSVLFVPNPKLPLCLLFLTLPHPYIIYLSIGIAYLFVYAQCFL